MVALCPPAASGYGEAKIPAWEMIRFLGQHHARLLRRLHLLFDYRARGRIIQSRSEDSIIREIEEMRDKTPVSPASSSDLGGPTANMYHLKCKDERKSSPPAAACPACFPDICENLNTDHSRR